jgi:TatD DNase family protein
MIDTHCHLDVAAFDDDRAAAIARAAAAGVVGILVPAIRPRWWPRIAELGRTRHPVDLRVAIGVHPQVVGALGPDELPRDPAGNVDIDALEATLTRAAAVHDALAIGECGLDGNSADRDAQAAVLRAHIRAARALDLPLVLHVFRAHDQALRLLRDERARAAGGILHSYSGGADLVPAYADLGLAFSFAGPVTYANARRPVAAARRVPRELLLAETDAPDQAPQAHRHHRSEPAFVADVIAGLATSLAEPPGAIAALTTANARRLLRWDGVQ